MLQGGEIILVRYGFHVDDLFNDPNDYICYDADACARRYAEICRAELERIYPGAKVEVRFDTNTSGILPGSMRTEVLRREFREDEVCEVSDLYEIESVEDLCNNVIHGSSDWEVSRYWLTVEEAHEITGIPVSSIYWACREGLIGNAEKTAGRWRFPTDAFVEMVQDYAFANCIDLLSFEISSDSFYKFKCFSDEILSTRTADLPMEAETLLVVSDRFEIPLFSKDNSVLVVSKHAPTVSVVFEHFLGENPWTGVLWSYDTFAKELVFQARQYDYVKCELWESERAGRSFVDGMQFVFQLECLPTHTLGGLIGQAAEILDNAIQDAKAHLSGGPVWRQEYEKDEGLFCTEVLAPLLRKMGFRYVRYTHGPDEFGKDFTFSQPTEFGELSYGLQAKAGNVRGGIGSEIDELLGQIEDAFTIPYREVGSNEDKFITVLIIAISGRYTDNARKKIKHKMPKSLVGSVHFWDQEKILSLIAKCWADRR